MTVIEKKPAVTLGLCDKAVASREAHGAGGALSSSMSTIESMKVGDVEAKNLQIGVLDLSNLTKRARSLLKSS